MLNGMPTTPKARKALERERKRKAGLRPLEVWALPEHHHKFKELERLLVVESLLEPDAAGVKDRVVI